MPGRVRLVAVLCCWLGCQRGGADKRSLPEAEREVRRFFALLEAGDCTQLRALMARPESCDGMVHEYQETASRLVEVVEVKPDGRDARIVLITVHVQDRKRLHTWVVRARPRAGGWEVSL